MKKLHLRNTKQEISYDSNTISRNHIDLSFRGLEGNGHLVAQLIRHWPDEQPLQECRLYNYSLTAAALLELVQSLSTCRKLTRLHLQRIKLGEAGHQLAQCIRSWGDEPPLQRLLLNKCSLTAAASLELVQSLSTCRKLTKLDLEENKLGEAGHQLAQSIRSWGDEPPLDVLQLYDCSLTATASLELVQSLSTCMKLTALNLGENMLGEARHQLAQSIRSWGDEPPLQRLLLYNCSLTAAASVELVQTLFRCRHLWCLDLQGNDMDKTGHQLARTLRSSLQLYLSLPDHSVVSAVPKRQLVTEAGEVDNMIQASNFEFERGTVVRGANQLEGVGRTSFGNVVQETAQRHMYHEDMTELGVTIRRYKNERLGSLSPVPFDSVGAEGLGVTENPSFGEHGINKCSSEELLTLQVDLTKFTLKAYRFCCIINMFAPTSAKILNFFMKNYALRKKK